MREPSFPPGYEAILHFLLHLLILALCVFTLVALWTRATIGSFGGFLAWTILFYILLFLLAWRGYPRSSILATIIFRLHVKPSPPPPTEEPVTQPTPMTEPPEVATSQSSFGPYLHKPTYHSTLPSTSHEDDRTTALSNGGHRSTEDDSDGEEDEDARQQRIEAEMNRREVSIVTVPKRRLWVANPS
jgi:hypothetical protein